jgi:hypothetical protein
VSTSPSKSISRSNLKKEEIMANIKMNLAAMNRFLSRTVQPYLRQKAEEIADEARRRAPRGATGALQNSISVGLGPKGSVQIRVSADYAGFVHEGTGPQATPPRAAYYPKLRRRGLILWSDSKNLNPQAVAHGISQRGTSPNPFLTESVEVVLNRFNFKWIRRDLVA